MPELIRLDHRVLDGRYHVYTSPDLKGLHVAADTKAEAQRKAITVLHAIAAELGASAPVVEFREEPIAA